MSRDKPVSGILKTDVVIVGAGAAGLAAAIFAGESAGRAGRSIVVVESAAKPGAKILVSGGGRCNVTNARVTPSDYAGGPQHIIRKVLREFDTRKTIDWFSRLGVELKEEDNGKLFPVTDSARTVLEALLERVGALEVRLLCGIRVSAFRYRENRFHLSVVAAPGAVRAAPKAIVADRLIVATGGLALPKSGSDGAGLAMARKLGHAVIPATPALCPLKLRAGSALGGRFAEFAGLTLETRLILLAGVPESRAAASRRIHAHTGSLLFTHVGISGPVVMDMSRHWHRARLEMPDTPLLMTMGVPSLPDPATASEWLIATARRHPRKRLATVLRELLPERFADAMAGRGRANAVLAELTRDRRRELAVQLTELPLEVIDSRGYAYAETTAGGIDLRDVDVRTMQSRKIPNLFFCGEILDADGRIGGYNFQWAWATGYLAGRGVFA